MTCVLAHLYVRIENFKLKGVSSSRRSNIVFALVLVCEIQLKRVLDVI